MNKQSIEFLEKEFNIVVDSPGGIKKLRELILTLAMQGRLVEQDPNDQPAEKLIAEIEKEKKRLISKGKIKKQKSMPEITPEEVPYEMPKGWQWVRLSEIGQINPKNNVDDTIESGFVPMTLIEDGIKNCHTYETRVWREIRKGHTHIHYTNPIT